MPLVTATAECCRVASRLQMHWVGQKEQYKLGHRQIWLVAAVGQPYHTTRENPEALPLFALYIFSTILSLNQ